MPRKATNQDVRVSCGATTDARSEQLPSVATFQDPIVPHLRNEVARLAAERPWLVRLPDGRAHEMALDTVLSWFVACYRRPHGFASAGSSGRVLVSRKPTVWFSPSSLARSHRGSPGFTVKNHSTEKSRPTSIRVERWLVEAAYKNAARSLNAEIRSSVTSTGTTVGATDLSSRSTSGSDLLSNPPSSTRPTNLDVGSPLVPPLVAIGDRSASTLRVTNWSQRLKRSHRELAFGGLWDNDIVKGHPGVVSCEMGADAPELARLYATPSLYAEHAEAAGVPIALVKLAVNQHCIASPCNTSPKASYVKAAKSHGIEFEDAARSLDVIRARLAPVFAEIDVWLARTFAGVPKRDLPSVASTYLMRRQSLFIFACERECRRLGIVTWNLHDGFHSDAEVPAWVFQAAATEVGLGTIRVRCRRIGEAA